MPSLPLPPSRLPPLFGMMCNSRAAGECNTCARRGGGHGQVEDSAGEAVLGDSQGRAPPYLQSEELRRGVRNIMP